MFRKLTPEEELLLCCARTRLEPQTAARVSELLEGGVDWNRLIVLARRHFATQLLYWHLSERVKKVAPMVFTQELERNFRANVDRNFYLANELLRLLPLFETDGIPVIPFKGPVFAVNVYKNIALRTYGDLDILIRKQDIARATKLLSSAGYIPRHSGSHVKDAIDRRQDTEYPFVSMAQKWLAIDLHWDLAGKRAACKHDIADLFSDARLMPLFGRTIHTLSPEDLLLYSCIHAVKHPRMHLRWICDIAEIIRAFPLINWEHLEEKAHHSHCSRMFYAGLLLAADLLDAPVPKGALHKIKSDRSVQKVVTRVKWQLFEETEALPQHIWILQNIGMKERFRDKLKIFLFVGLVPSPDDYDALPLPAQITGLYFAIRPLRLALKLALASPQLLKYRL